MRVCVDTACGPLDEYVNVRVLSAFDKLYCKISCWDVLQVNHLFIIIIF